MRLKLALLAAAFAAAAAPAAAQSYRSHDPCTSQRGENQIAGALLGGILGGVVGSNVAASGHRHDGTAVGAVVGGLVGSQIGRKSVDCQARTYYPSYPQTTYPAPVHGQSYGQGYGYDRYPSAYGSSPGYGPPNDYGYDPGYRGYDDYDRRYGDRDTSSRDRDGLYGRGNGDYIPGDDYAGRDCSVATQITRLPDGTEVHRKVDACRDAYYGGWKIQD